MGITHSAELTQKIKAFALSEVRFSLVGISPATLENRYTSAYRQWLDKGFHGDMAYMAREPERRMDPDRILPGARSVISLALNYYHPEDPKPVELAGKISKYARGTDYHKIIEKKLKRLARFVREQGGQAKIYVDTGPVLERAFAEQAGLGFIGKNANLISKNFGSWVFLASVVTDLDLNFDVVGNGHARSLQGSCGTCRLCIDACPTQAIVASGQIDARRCISYLTIESREAIPVELGQKMGEWMFGCDVCQDVCPYNRKAKETSEAGFLQPIAGSWLSTGGVQTIQSDEEFRERFRGSPVLRAKRQGLQRNAETVQRAI